MLFGSIRRSRNQIEEQSANRSSSVTPKVAFARQLGEDLRMRQASRPVERAQRAGEPPVPAVRRRDRVGRDAVIGSTNGHSAQTLSFGRRLFERPRERRERTAARPARHVVLREHGLHFVPERARLTRAALVGRGLANEIQAAARPRARGVEEVTVTRDLIRPRQSCTRALVEITARVVAQERRLVPATRQASLLEAEQEHAPRSAACGHARGRARRSVPLRLSTSAGPPLARRAAKTSSVESEPSRSLQPRSSSTRRITASCARMS